MQPATIMTIGHSNHPIEKLVGLLQASAVEVVVDTRSQPYSKYTVQFNREALQSAIAGAGMKYLYLGRELGGRPEGAGFYDAEGHVLYARVAESRPFREGIERVLACRSSLRHRPGWHMNSVVPCGNSRISRTSSAVRNRPVNWKPAK